jgi:hypothetical protein
MGRGACWAQRIDEARQRYRFCLDEVSHRGSKTGLDGRCAVGVDAGWSPPRPPALPISAQAMLEAVPTSCAASGMAHGETLTGREG